LQSPFSMSSFSSTVFPKTSRSLANKVFFN
jgi:hypothetical protein